MSRACEKCVHYFTKVTEEPCKSCFTDEKEYHPNFSADIPKPLEETVQKPQPLLTKNEYLALELTKIYVGQDMKPIAAANIADKYDYFLGRFNKETET